MHIPHPQTGWTRWSYPVARGLSVLLVGLQLVGIAHLALVPHGMSWERGTVIELGAGKLTRAALAPVCRGLSLNAGQSAVQLGDSDDHPCPVQASRRDWGGPPAAAALGLSFASMPGVAVSAAVASRGDDALLLRAPKQSPPAGV